VITPAAYPPRPAPGGAPIRPWHGPAPPARFGPARFGPARLAVSGRARRRLTPRPWCRPSGSVRRRRGRVGGGLGRLWDGLVGGV